MNTQYGTYTQSGLTGQQPTNNGIQGQPAFAAQQRNYVNRMNTATPNHNNLKPTMPTVRGALHNQQPLPYGQPDFAVQQLVGGNGNGNGSHQNMTFRNRQGTSTPAPFAHGNTLLVHNGDQAQPGFFGHQMFDLNGDEVAMAVAADPNVMAGFAQLRNAILRQRAQRQSPQNYQETQYYQNHQVRQHQQGRQNYNGGVGFNFVPSPPGSAISSGKDLPVVDLTQPSNENITLSTNRANCAAGNPNQPLASTPHDVGAAEPVQPAMGPELTENFQELVNGLVAKRGTAFGGHIRSDADVARFEKAIWMAKSKGGKLENKCADFPNDEAERSKIVRRIFNAIVNTGGDQDLVTDTAENGDCLAVRVIKGMSPLEIEILAKKLMDNSVKVQRGDPVLPPNLKVVQEENLMDKVNKVVEALSHNKALCRSATTTAEWIARIAADPAGERGQKNFNRNNNRAKNTVLKADAQKKGKSRAKGTNKGKGKGKRSAEAEAEAEPSQETPAEATEAADASQRRPAKRARTTEKAAPTTQTNTQRQTPNQVQVQQNQRISVNPNNGHASTHLVNAVQGNINPNQGAVNPLNHQANISHGFVQQSPQTNLSFVFGQNNQANFDPSFGGFPHEFQTTDVADNNLVPNHQIDGANNLSPDAAAIRNHGLELAQPQSDMSDEWMEFLNSDSMNGLDFDYSFYTAPQDDSAMNQQVVSAQQYTQQLPAQHQPAGNQPSQYQPVPQQQQVHQQELVKSPVQQRSQESENAEQINNDFFGSLSYEQLEADLAPLARFNAEN